MHIFEPQIFVINESLHFTAEVACAQLWRALSVDHIWLFSIKGRSIVDYVVRRHKLVAQDLQQINYHPRFSRNQHLVFLF